MCKSRIWTENVYGGVRVFLTHTYKQTPRKALRGQKCVKNIGEKFSRMHQNYLNSAKFLANFAPSCLLDDFSCNFPYFRDIQLHSPAVHPLCLPQMKISNRKRWGEGGRERREGGREDKKRAKNKTKIQNFSAYFISVYFTFHLILDPNKCKFNIIETKKAQDDHNQRERGKREEGG